jgi:hypothetical protein
MDSTIAAHDVNVVLAERMADLSPGSSPDSISDYIGVRKRTISGDSKLAHRVK